MEKQTVQQKKQFPHSFLLGCIWSNNLIHGHSECIAERATENMRENNVVRSTVSRDADASQISQNARDPGLSHLHVGSNEWDGDATNAEF